MLARGTSPVQLILIAQALTVVVAPMLGVLLVILSNKRRLMGNLRNKPWQIRDETGETLPLGEIGEIYAKVEAQLRTFWNDEAATAERLVDGWVRTRDVGRIDSNGYLYVLDRADDMIVSDGFKHLASRTRDGHR